MAGLDEVGRGCLAGPVAAGAVILPQSPAPQLFEVVRDSKRLSAKQRDEAYRDHNTFGGFARGRLGRAGGDRRHRHRSGDSARHASSAFAKLRPAPDALLIDAMTLPSVDLPQKAIIRGDGKSLSIAAASIVAKVERDRLMAELAQEYEDYGFERHKGYGTARHLDAIRRLGPTPIHRMSFRPLRDIRPVVESPTTGEIGQDAESFAALALKRRGMRIIATQLQLAVRRGGPCWRCPVVHWCSWRFGRGAQRRSLRRRKR